MKGLRKCFLSVIMALAMIITSIACPDISFLPGKTVEMKADQTPVEYAFYNEASGTFETRSCDSYVLVADADNLTMSGGQWYVFDGSVSITNRIEVAGTANIILKDNCVFTASNGINVASGSAINIYGQGTINGENVTSGELIATGGKKQSGIGGGDRQAGGYININGGKITAVGGAEMASDGAAGIGGGNGGTGGYITINGGEVTANGGNSGAGIGGGKNQAGGSITINGGEVTAYGRDAGAGIGGGSRGDGGNITINGGEVTSYGGYSGAGIGGGLRGFGGNITINGGEVTATGGYSGGSGIGSASIGSWGIITINGGKVTATGIDGGCGIGGGYHGAAGSITINGGEVTAVGGAFETAIGGDSDQAGGSITITGGIVNATGKESGAGIGGEYLEAGGTITITGGMIEAVGGNYHRGGSAGIGEGFDAQTHGTYELGSGMKWFVSDSETSGYYEMTGNGTFGENKQYAIVYKEHSGVLTVSGSSITAKYIEGGEKKTVDLAIHAPSEIIYGDADTAKAGLDGYESFNTELGRPQDMQVSASQIQYLDANGQLLGEAPTAKGNYSAQITVDGVIAAADYAITKEDPVITVSGATSLEYTGNDQPLITQGTTSGGTLKYSFSENGTFSTDIPTGKNVGTYTVYYKVEGNNEFKSSIVYSFSTEITLPDSNNNPNPNPAPNPGINAEPEPTPVQNPEIREHKNPDGSVTTKSTFTHDNGSVTITEKTVAEDGSYILISETKDKDGKLISRTDETKTISKKGTAVVTTKTVNASGLTLEKTVKTTKKGYAESSTVSAQVTKKGNTQVVIKNTDSEGYELLMAFTLKRGVAVLTSFEISDGYAVIPDQITVNGVTYPIGSIRKASFKNNKDIVNATIGKNVSVIGSKAFYRAVNLKYIFIYGKLEKVGKGAFKGIADDAVIKIKATKAVYKQIVELIKASGVGKNVKFKRIK